MPTEPVRRAIASAYHAFRHVPPPKTLDATPLRDADAILRGLTSAALPNLSPEHVGPYAGWAMTTVGGSEDYRHFLPRILELAAANEPWIGLEPEIIAERLRLAEWDHWPPSERDAVSAVFLAAWDRASRRHPDDEDASDWLRGLAAIGIDLTAPLNAWIAAPHREMAPQVSAFVFGMAKFILAADDRHHWSWPAREPSETVLRTWLSGAELRRFLNEAREVVERSDVGMIDSALMVLDARR